MKELRTYYVFDEFKTKAIMQEATDSFAARTIAAKEWKIHVIQVYAVRKDLMRPNDWARYHDVMRKQA